jgi:hypothetical protein
MASNTNSLSFSRASSQRVDVTNPTGLNSLTIMTVECWVKLSSTELNQGFVSRSDSVNLNQFTFSTQTTNVLQAHVATTASDWFVNFATGTVPIVINTWTHVAMVFNGTQSGNSNRFKFYINGVLDAGTTYTGTIPAALTSITQVLSIALRESGGGSYTNGLMDEVRIWNTARTAAELLNNKDTEISGTTSGLIYYWKFNDGTGTTAIATTGGLNGTLINTPTWMTDVPFPTGFSDATGGGNPSYSFFL